MTPASRDRLQPAAPGTTHSSVSIDHIVLLLCERIDGLLVEEARLLSAASPEALDQLIDRKEHLALEVSRVTQMAQGYQPSPQVKSRMGGTLDSLSRHTEHVRRHVEAVRSITAMISGLYCEATGDGTYDGSTPVRVGQR